MRDANKLTEDHIVLLNDRDQIRRLALLQDTWTPDATCADPSMTGTGHKEIDALIGAVQTKCPDFRFNLVKDADGFW